LSELEIPKFTLKKIFGSVNTEISTLLSALGYDWVYKRPDLAENFYRIIKEKVDVYSLRDKIKVADYYLRTGRPETIPDILKKHECMATFKYKSKCYYYLGVSKYLITGENKNSALKIAKSKIKKAKEIYYKK